MRFPFTKPHIKATLKTGGGATRIHIDANKEQAILLAYQLLCGLAKKFGMEERQLMNRIIKLDKRVVAFDKKKERAERYGK